MRINGKRNTLGAFLLATLTLFLFGCSDTGSAPATSPALITTKSITGVVSDSNGVALANATVTAYAIDANGTPQMGTPLSVPASAKSDGSGRFTLNIPVDYAGSVMVVANTGAAKATVGTGKQVALTGASGRFRALLTKIQKGPGTLPPVMISLATEMLVQYVEINKTHTFTSGNIQQAVLVLENFFGVNFTQTPPPPPGAPAGTRAQQDLMVMIQALNSLVGVTIQDLVTLNTSTNTTGFATHANGIVTAIAQVQTTLIAGGTIPAAYQSTITVIYLQTPTPEPDVSDTTPPTAPTNLTAKAATTVSSTVTLTWTASTDNKGVDKYLIYRNGEFFQTLPAVPQSNDPSFSLNGTTYTWIDSSVNADTSYTYVVQARDLAGNLSAGSTVTVATPPIPTFTISGTITSGGLGLTGVTVAITGAGTGSMVTGTDGKYTFTGVRPGTYTITPSRTDANGVAVYAFTPPSATVTVTDANVTQDFTAALTGSVTGTTTFPNGSVSTTMTFPNGTVVTTTTFPDGSVTTTTTFPNGSITTTTTYPTNAPSVTLNFGYLVTGIITSSSTGNPLGGVSVAISAAGIAPVTTSSFGTYTFRGVQAGSYTVTPTLAGYTFTPASPTVTVTISNVTQNFTSTP